MNAEEAGLNPIYAAAERYVKLGISVIPILPATKEPPIGFKWGEFARRIADASERYSWFVEHDWQLAIVSGPVSGWLVPLDFDGPGGYESLAVEHPRLRELPRLRTGSDKHHVWLRVPQPTRKYVTHAPDGSNLEVRAGTHYTLVPPSIHPSGEPYVWEQAPWAGVPVVDLAELGLPSRPPDDGKQEDASYSEGEPLTDAEAEHIIELLTPHYVPYSRHELCLALSGWLAGHGVPEADARSIVETLAEQAGDVSRLREFLRGVRDTYRKAREGITVAGWSRLTDRSAPLISPSTAKQLDLLLRYRQAEFRFTASQQSDQDDPETARAHPWIISVADLLKEPEEPDTWLVEGLVRDATLGLVVGPPKTYKSFFVQEMAVSLATGMPMFGAYEVPEPVNVIYVQEESARRFLRRRFRSILAGHELHPGALKDSLYAVTNEHFRLDEPAQLERLIKEGIEAFDAKVVIFDPLRELHWQDENKAEAMMPILSALKSIRDAYGVNIQLVHHNNKNPAYTSPADSIRGSTAIWGAMDSGIFLSTTDREDEMKVQVVLKEGGQVPHFLYRIESDEQAIRFNVMDLDGRKRGKSNDHIVTAIRSIGWASREDIASAVGLSTKRLLPRLNVLIEAGKLKRRERPAAYGQGKKYFYAVPEQSDDEPLL